MRDASPRPTSPRRGARLLAAALFTSSLAAGLGAPAGPVLAGDTPPSTGSAAAATSPTLAPVPSPTVTLVDGGKGTKRKLRYRYAAGTKDSARMTMDMKMAMSMNGQAMPSPPIPTMVLSLDTVITGVDKDGAARYEMTLHRSATPTEGADEMARAMDKALSALDGLVGRATITDRGHHRDLHYDIPEGADPQARQMIQQMEGSMSQIGALLPDEAVGVGAKWDVRSRIVQNGIALDQVSQFELLAFDGVAGTVKVTVTGQADLAALDRSQIPPGAELKDVRSTGVGETRFDLRRMMPIRADVTATTKVGMAAQIGDTRSEMGIDAEMKMVVEGT